MENFMIKVKPGYDVFTILVLTSGLLSPVYAEDKSDTELHVTVSEITDKRTTGKFFAECEVKLKIMGDPVADVMGARITKLMKAVDSTDRNLLKDEEREIGDLTHHTNQTSVMEVTIKLRNPSRNAATIKTLEGELELIRPTLENGGKIVVADFQSNAGEPIATSQLQPWNVEVIHLTKEGFEKMKGEMEKEKKSMDAAAEKMGEAFGELFMGVFNIEPSDDENALQFYIKDPDKHIVNLGFTDQNAKTMKSTSRSTAGNIQTYTFKDKPSKDWRLVISLSTPTSTRTRSFKVENIPLP